MGVDVSFDLSSSTSSETTSSFRSGTTDEFVELWHGNNPQRHIDRNGGNAPATFEVEESETTTSTTITGTVGVDLQQQRKGKKHTLSTNRLILSHWVTVSYLVKSFSS